MEFGRDKSAMKKGAVSTKAKVAQTPRFGFVKKLVLPLVVFIVGLVAVMQLPKIDYVITGWDVGRVEKITVLGDLTYIPEVDVMDALQPYSKSSVFTLPLEEIQQKLEAIAWVDRAIVGRKLPFELVVTVVPQKPIARWRKEGLVNNHGEIFLVDEIAEEFAMLPVLDGEANELTDIMSAYIDINKVLRGKNLEIVNLQRTESGAWSVQTNDGGLVIFGGEKIVEAAKRFVAVHRYLGNEAANRRFDTRHNSGVAVL